MNTYIDTSKNSALLYPMVQEHTSGSLTFVKVTGHGKINIASTFDCGQCFRFDPVENTAHEYEVCGVAYGRCVSFATDDGGNTLYVYNSTEKEYREIWHKYLCLDVDYDEIDRDITSRSDKEVLALAVEKGSGIRILAQEPWETVCSFIISQNNNIPRIKKIIASMSRELGELIPTENMKGHLSNALKDGAYSFPSAQAVALAGVDVIAALRTGFRAKYIYDAADKISRNELSLDEIAQHGEGDTAAKMLMTVKGIGPKVAACSLLFGFRRYDAFPIDVWIKRVMEKYFPKDFSPSEMGPYAGVAQQYLFYYERYLNGGF